MVNTLASVAKAMQESWVSSRLRLGVSFVFSIMAPALIVVGLWLITSSITSTRSAVLIAVGVGCALAGISIGLVGEALLFEVCVKRRQMLAGTEKISYAKKTFRAPIIATSIYRSLFLLVVFLAIGISTTGWLLLILPAVIMVIFLTLVRKVFGILAHNQALLEASPNNDASSLDKIRTRYTWPRYAIASLILFSILPISLFASLSVPSEPQSIIIWLAILSTAGEFLRGILSWSRFAHWFR